MLKHSITFAAIAGLLFALAPAGAATYQWDAQSGTGSTVEDGTGAWQVGGPNWYDQTTAANDVTWVDGNDAVFGGGISGAAGTVTVSGPVSPAGLTFNQPFAGDYTLSGGTINLGSGGITDNATGTATVSSIVTRANDTTITTAAGSHLILSGGGSGPYKIRKEGAGTLTLDGTTTVGSGTDQMDWYVDDGTLEIAGEVTLADWNKGELSSNPSAAMNITGAFTTGGHDQIMRGDVTLSGTGRWNLRGGGIFAVANGGDTAVLNIRDDAVLDVDRSVGSQGAWSVGSLVICMGWGPCTGAVNQDGGTVNADFPTESWDTGNGPGLVMGGVVNRPHEAKVETYNLNGGTLNTSGVFNVYMEDDVLADPANGGHIATFNFNGGLLKASQGDSTDAQVIGEGLDHLMGNLTNAFVKAGGAIIDTNGFNASINQALEHDPALGGAPDGGLQKLGDGALTLLQASTYTGDTSVDAGVLEVMDIYLDDASSVSVLSGAMMDLDFTGTDLIAGLTLGGVAQGPGTYNIGSNPAYFTGTGSLRIIGDSAPGDANGDTKVDHEDLAIFNAQFGLRGPDRSCDFDGDDDVDLDDFKILKDQWGWGVPAPGGAPAPSEFTATPEPASAVLLLLGLGAVIRRRKK